MQTLDAEGHFQEIQEQILRDVKCVAISEGHSNIQEDIDTALSLMACIGVLNKQVLDSNVCLHFHPDKHPDDIIAEYIGCGDGNEKDEFGVYVKDSAEIANNAVGSWLVLPDSSQGIIDIKSIPLFSFVEYILAVALHEIRHRLQSRGLVKMFTLESAQACEDVFLSSLINATFIAFLIKKREYKKAGKSKRFIDYRINIWEFDVQIVVSYIISKLKNGMTRKQMVNMLRLEP